MHKNNFQDDNIFLYLSQAPSANDEPFLMHPLVFSMLQ